MKRFTVTAGSRSNPITNRVEIPNASGPITPEQARAAARVAVGHTTGVTVTDNSGDGYRLNGKDARKIPSDW